MSALKLFLAIVKHIQEQPERLTSAPLDEIAAAYSPYAYIGNRRRLRNIVKREAEHLKACAEKSNFADPATWWFGMPDWNKDSGVFPDFVIAWRGTGTVGDGALVELKDSQSSTIASFNSTLPTARKPLSSLEGLVSRSARKFESCWLQNRARPPDERDCFYLVRTHREDREQCRLSLVQGTFFETLPTHELLGKLWEDVLGQARVPEELRKEIVPWLQKLGRAELSQTRKIEGASIKPRLRLMSEIEPDGNPHTYSEIVPRSVNLILKLPDQLADLQQAKSWAESEFLKDGISLEGLDLKIIQHRRNGLHLVLQKVLPSLQSP